MYLCGMKSIINIFRRKPKTEPMPLRIEGIAPAPMTPEPDDAELAAQALLEHLSGSELKADAVPRPSEGRGRGGVDKPGTTAYYQNLAAKIKSAHQMEARLALRYVAYCEEMLSELSTPGRGGVAEGRGEVEVLATLNHGLFRHQTAVDREGGELKRRWQHCLATVTVRLMS